MKPLKATTRLTRLAAYLLLAVAALVVLSPPSAAQATGPSQYIIELEEPSVVEAMAEKEPAVPMRAKLASLRAVEHEGFLAARQEQVRRQLERVAHLRVQAQTRTILNAIIAVIDSNDVARVRALPGVRAVHRSKEYRMVLDAAIPLIRADQGWGLLGGLDQAGRGLKIGILDSGIDISNSMFQDASLTPPAGFPKGESSFTNSKVIVARNYINLLSRPDVLTAEDRSGHGSFAAGCAAGNQASSPAGLISGVAPKAFLGNYKVFGTPGVNSTTNSSAIIAALNQAVQDGMDIVNLSLGGLATQLPGDDPEVRAINNAIQANVIVVVAAGNEGQQGPSSISSPGIAPNAITVGATSNSRALLPSLGVTAPTPVPQNLQQLGYRNGTGPRINTTIGPLPITATAALGNPLACTPLPGGSLTGRVALIERGSCNFVDKVTNATNAGALAVIVFNSATQPNQYVIMALLENTTVPAVFILRADGLNLENFINNNPTTARVQITTQVAAIPTTPDLYAAFSSQGPNVDLSIKPDLVGPGINIFSATQDNFSGSDMFSANGFIVRDGTSFATPMVAGAAALVRQLHPTFTPDQVKSVLVSRASSQVTVNGQAAGVQLRGGGRLDVLAALGARASALPVTISFGQITFAVTLSRALTIQNFQNAAETYTVLAETTSTPGGATVSVDRGSLSIPAGLSDTINVQLQVSSVTTGVIQGQIHIQPAGGADLFVPFWGAINAGARPTNLAVVEGDDQEGNAGSQLSEQLVVRVTDQNGVPMQGVTVQWSAGTGGSVSPATSTTTSFGLAATRATLGLSSGQQTFTARVGSLSVQFTASASSGTANFEITSISPAQGSPAGGTTVVISGNLFQNGAVVTFGTEVAQVASLTSTAITVVAPPNNPGRVDVTVTNPGGQSTVASAGYTYTAPTSLQFILTQTSMNFFAAQGDTRVQEQQVGILNLAEGITTWTVASSVNGNPPRNWLSVSPLTGVSPLLSGTLSVRVDPQGLPVGPYTGQVTVSAAGVNYVVDVTLSVLAAAPSLFLSQVADGQLATGGQFRTSVIVVNPNSAAAHVSLQFRGDDGSPLNVALLTGQRGDTFSFTIPARGTLFAETDGGSASPVLGSAQIQSDLPVGGAGIFLQRVPNRLDFEAGIGLALPSSTVVMPVDNTPGFNTGVAIVNSSTQPANLSLTFRDEQGAVRGTAALTLPAMGHTSALATNLIPATQSRRGTLTIQSLGDARVTAVSVRGQDSGALTTLPVVDNASPAARFTLPQLVDGQQIIPAVGTVLYDTSWIFINPGVLANGGSVALLNDIGSPLTVTLRSGETSNVFGLNLASRQASFLQTNSSSTSVLFGQSFVATTLPMGGAAIFRQRVPNRPDFEAGIGFSVPGQRFILPFDNSTGFASGLAASSTSGEGSVTITFIARREDGTEITRFIRELAGLGHTSFILRDVAPETAGQRGSIELSATAPVITAIGIRAFDSGPLTTLPVVPLAP